VKIIFYFFVFIVDQSWKRRKKCTCKFTIYIEYKLLIDVNNKKNNK